MAKAGRKSKAPRRWTQAEREREARAAAAWAVSGGPSQHELPFDDPHRQFLDRVRYEMIYNAVMAKPPTAKKRKDGYKIRLVKRALPKLYPPKGRVPVGVSITTVRYRLEHECELKVGWDTVDRVVKAQRQSR